MLKNTNKNKNKTKFISEFQPMCELNGSRNTQKIAFYFDQLLPLASKLVPMTKFNQ